MSPDKAKRITIDDVFNHPWVVKYEKEFFRDSENKLIDKKCYSKTSFANFKLNSSKIEEINLNSDNDKYEKREKLEKKGKHIEKVEKVKKIEKIEEKQREKVDKFEIFGDKLAKKSDNSDKVDKVDKLEKQKSENLDKIEKKIINKLVELVNKSEEEKKNEKEKYKDKEKVDKQDIEIFGNEEKIENSDKGNGNNEENRSFLRKNTTLNLDFVNKLLNYNSKNNDLKASKILNKKKISDTFLERVNEEVRLENQKNVIIFSAEQFKYNNIEEKGDSSLDKKQEIKNSDKKAKIKGIKLHVGKEVADSISSENINNKNNNEDNLSKRELNTTKQNSKTESNKECAEEINIYMNLSDKDFNNNFKIRASLLEDNDNINFNNNENEFSIFNPCNTEKSKVYRENEQEKTFYSPEQKIEVNQIYPFNLNIDNNSKGIEKLYKIELDSNKDVSLNTSVFDLVLNKVKLKNKSKIDNKFLVEKQIAIEEKEDQEVERLKSISSKVRNSIKKEFLQGISSPLKENALNNFDYERNSKLNSTEQKRNSSSSPKFSIFQNHSNAKDNLNLNKQKSDNFEKKSNIESNLDKVSVSSTHSTSTTKNMKKEPNNNILNKCDELSQEEILKYEE